MKKKIVLTVLLGVLIAVGVVCILGQIKQLENNIYMAKRYIDDINIENSVSKHYIILSVYSGLSVLTLLCFTIIQTVFTLKIWKK